MYATYADKTVTLEYKGKTIHVTQSISGSGARFLGEGYEWWIKGKNATLSQGDSLVSANILEHCSSL